MGVEDCGAFTERSHIQVAAPVRRSELQQARTGDLLQRLSDRERAEQLDGGLDLQGRALGLNLGARTRVPSKLDAIGFNLHEQGERVMVLTTAFCRDLRVRVVALVELSIVTMHVAVAHYFQAKVLAWWS